MNETAFKKKLKEALDKSNLRFYSIENKVAPGMPDLLVLGKGNEARWVECKIDREPLNKYQKIWILKEAAEGGLVYELRLIDGSNLVVSRLRGGGMEIEKQKYADLAWPLAKSSAQLVIEILGGNVSLA